MSRVVEGRDMVFIASILDPVLVLPAFLIGLFAKGRLRLILAALFAVVLITLTVETARSSAMGEVLAGRLVGSWLAGWLGAFIARCRGRNVKA